MTKLALSMALMVNDRVRPIINGAVRPEGIDLNVTAVKTAGEIFWRQLHFQEFDVADMSLSEMLMLISRGDRTWVMLPVFMSRRFFHTGILVRSAAGIEEPADLRGKRIGVPEYIQSTALWARGVLQDEFGVAAEELQWHQERTEVLSHSTMFGLQSSGLFQHIPEEKNIGSMLLAGELDAAAVYHGVPNMQDRSDIDLKENPAVRHLFPDQHAEGLRYFQKTGIFPINRAPAIRRAIVEHHPWVVLNLYHAFVTAKEQAMAPVKAAADVHASLGWLTAEARNTLRQDPFPYGIQRNRKVLETCARYSHEQGLSPRTVALEEVFAAPTLDF